MNKVFHPRLNSPDVQLNLNWLVWAHDGLWSFLPIIFKGSSPGLLGVEDPQIFGGFVVVGSNLVQEDIDMVHIGSFRQLLGEFEQLEREILFSTKPRLTNTCNSGNERKETPFDLWNSYITCTLPFDVSLLRDKTYIVRRSRIVFIFGLDGHWKSRGERTLKKRKEKCHSQALRNAEWDAFFVCQKQVQTTNEQFSQHLWKERI